MVPFSLLLLEAKGVFLWYLLWEPVWAPGGKSYNITRVHGCLGPSGVFNSELLALSLQQFLNYSSSFPNPHTGPTWFLLPSLCSGKLLLPVFACDVTPVLGVVFCPMLSSLRIQEELLTFHSIQLFYLGWSGDFQVPEVETEVKSLCFDCSTTTFNPYNNLTK